MKRFLAVIIVAMMFVSGCTVKVPDTPIATETAQATATREPTAVPTATPTVTPTVAPTATSTASPTPTVTPTPVPTETPAATPEPTATFAPTPTPISDLTTVLPDGNTIADVLWYVSEDNTENARLHGYENSRIKGELLVLSNVYVSKSDGTVVDYTDAIRNAEERVPLPADEYEREYDTLDRRKSLIDITLNDRNAEFDVEAYVIDVNSVDPDNIYGNMEFISKVPEDSTGAALDYIEFILDTEKCYQNTYSSWDKDVFLHYFSDLQVLYSVYCISDDGERLLIRKIKMVLPTTRIYECLDEYNLYPLIDVGVNDSYVFGNDIAILFRKE